MARSSNNLAIALSWVKYAAFAGALLFPFAWAHGQLGATPEELTKLYGPVFRHGARIFHRQIYDSGARDGDIYQHDGIFIRAVCRQGRVLLLEFSRLDRPLTEKDVDALLHINAQGSLWETGKDSTDSVKYYRRLDDLAIAHWAVGEDGSLLISAEEPNHVGDKLLQ